ncbi:hypothetical protein F4820DRAFT_442812 [Hypoxylon rubiginosum]|uniref:Uncharacterized protein n=1 Tax=Hypoxylon rubiginosum TaxID=110542 RepID=A0ACB9ZHL5_9PEZI|nr:hypothetical protein F4820DRAFT_442812 [Hypoxylon rubiginosum]
MAGDMAIQTPLALLAQPTIPCSAAYESLRLPSYTRSIRLLSLDPSNDFATPLAGTLRQVSLDDADCPQFNALSYVWAYTNVSILAPILALLRRGKPQAQIYHELFLALLRQSSLAIILLLDAGRDAGSIADAAMAGAPSWVPNWGRWPTITIPDNYFARLRLGITTGFNPRVGLGQGPGTLLVYGHLKGHIEVCQGRFRKIDIDANITTLYKAVKTSVTWARAARNKTQLLTDFSFDWGSLSPNPDEDDVEQFFVKEMENCRPQDQSRDVAKKITRNLLEDKRILAYFIHLVNTITLDDRPKFLTSRGYIGCGSKGIAVGDRIALIDGVPAAPLILRPHNTSSPGISDAGIAKEVGASARCCGRAGRAQQ